MPTQFSRMSWLLAAMLAAQAQASDFARLEPALPGTVDVAAIAPVFDFDTDGCLPSAGISRGGDQNGGLKPSGSLTGGCRSATFLNTSNTVHRFACTTGGGDTYCGHFFALYFLKDQIVSNIESGHRHDWEYAAVWTKNGVVTHGSFSAHGDLTTSPTSQLAFQNGHLKIVYHKDGALTHAFRFAGSGEAAENPYGTFVTPAIVSWYEFRGDGWNNEVMRTLLNRFDYGSANLPVRDSSFLGSLNSFKPADYPAFTEAAVAAASPAPAASYLKLVNQASGLCMDINGGTMANGTNVMQWTCTGADWQRWNHDTATGLIHSYNDPRYCLDNGGSYANGANIAIARCHGGNSQVFDRDAAGYFSVRAAPNQVIDGYGTSVGDNIGTWWNWGGGANQRWTLTP